MRDLAQGERAEPIVLRRSDFWREFADEFNSVVLRVRKLEAELEAARTESPAVDRARDIAEPMPEGGSTAAYTAAGRAANTDASDLLATR